MCWFLQVLHHVSDVTMVMKECYRILKPKGALIINTCSTEQIWARWYLSLIPKATEKLTKKSVFEEGTISANSALIACKVFIPQYSGY